MFFFVLGMLRLSKASSLAQGCWCFRSLKRRKTSASSVVNRLQQKSTGIYLSWQPRLNLTGEVAINVHSSDSRTLYPHLLYSPTQLTARTKMSSQVYEVRIVWILWSDPRENIISKIRKKDRPNWWSQQCPVWACSQAEFNIISIDVCTHFWVVHESLNV